MEHELSRAGDALPGSTEDASGARDAHDGSVADSIPAFLTFMTATGEVERVNRQVLEYLGATSEEARQWSTTDIVHPDDRSAVVAAWTRSVATGEPYEIEHRIRRADGVYRWFHVRGLPLRNAEGAVARWHVLQTDIDDRKRAEALLAGENRVLEMVASGRPLRAVLEVLCDVVDATLEGSISSVGLPEPTHQRVGTVIGARVPEGYRRSLVGGLFEDDARPCGRAARSKTQVIVSDVESEPAWAATDWAAQARTYGLGSCWSTPIVSLSGQLLGVFTIYQHERAMPAPFDETVMRHFTHLASIALERERHDEALRRSEAFLLEAQRISATGSFAWLVRTDEIIWSEQVYRMFEIDPGVPVTFALIASRVHPDDLPLLQEMIDRARSGASHVEYEHRLLMPDCSVKHLRLIAHGRYDGCDRLEYIGAVQDVTVRRQSEDSVARLRSDLTHVSRVATLGTLTASIAHEVNQPLSGIVTNASTCLRMLGADPPNVDGARETARRTIRDAGRASDVIARLRALFGGKAFTPESIDLNEATREVMALVARELREGHVTLDADLADDLGRVTGDRVQLQQVVLNLLLNAADAMSEVHDRPRQVVVRTEPGEGNCVRLSVRDAGPGFAAENAERLFDAFYTTKSSGMGIGLSVSRAIIENHHGRLWGTTNDGPGATFAFVIPRALETGAGRPLAAQAPTPRTGAPVTEHPSW